MTERSSSPPRVAIDARWAQGEPVGGIGRMLRSVLPRLATKVDVLALTDPRRGDLPLDVDHRELRTPIPMPAIGWLELCVPRFLASFPGIFHSVFYLLPRRCRAPSIVTLHDVSFETHPHRFPFAKRSVWRSNVRRGVKKAAAIHTVSDWSRDEIVRCYGLPAESIAVIPNGVEPDFHPLTGNEEQELSALLGRLHVRRSYLVALGGAGRRNVDIAVEAWKLLRRRGLPHDLVVLGSVGDADEGLVAVPLLPDREYRQVLAGAALFLYPTEYEGFGLPAVEAMASGTPPVCSRISALPEVLVDAAVWADRSAEGIASASEEVLRKADMYRRLVDAGLARARRFDWDVAADQLAELYRQVAMR